MYAETRLRWLSEGIAYGPSQQDPPALLCMFTHLIPAHERKTRNREQLVRSTDIKGVYL